MRSHSRLRTTLMIGTALLTAVAAPAFAQTATTAPTQDEQVTGLDDIVVTATRRETNLQDTPIAVSVVNAEALQNRHVQSLYDLADGAVPSLRVATFEARQSALTVGIRGIVPLDANQPAREQGVGIYVDGVYLARQHGLNAGLFDVQRIEVLRGPQGTLFGRNTEGGALNIVTREPSGVFGGRIDGGVGNYGSYSQGIHLDLPEYNNFALKIDGVIQHQDETTKNPLAGQLGWNYYDRQGIRAALRWTPTEKITNIFSYDTATDENTPFYSQLLNYNPNNCAAGTQASQPACTLPGTSYTALTGTVRPLLPGVVVNGDSRMKVADIGVPQQASVDETFGYTNTLRYDITDQIQLRSITAYRGVDATQWDNSGGAHRPPVVVPGCTGTGCNFSRYSLADLHQTQFSQEFQAVGSAGSFDFVGGLFYFKENVEDDAATPNSMAIQGYTTAGQTTGYTYVVLDPCTGSGGVGSQPGCRSIDRASEVESTSYAAYGQVTWNVSDALHLTAGGRYTRDHKDGELLISRNVVYATNPTIAATNGYTPLDETWKRFNPTATVAYDFSDDIHVYAKYATGYRSGGASSRTANYQAFGPEDVKSYEAGFKGDFWEHRARLNVAAYAMDREDSQVDISSIQFTGTGSFNNLVTINAPGKTKIRGLEAEFTVRPIEGLTLNASYAYTDTEIPLVQIVNTVTTPAPAGSPAGTPPTVTVGAPVDQRFYIVFTPKNAVSASIDYETPVFSGAANLRFHFDGNYAQATQAFDQFETKADESLIFNGRISLADIRVGDTQNLSVSVWGRNLFDEQYIFRRDPSNSLPGAPTTSLTTGSIGNVMGDYGNFNAPRTFGLEASVSF